MPTVPELKAALHAEREATFFRLRGGFPIPLAGATWWAFLAFLGTRLHSPGAWIMIAFYTSGLIFPLAVLYAKLFRNNFLGDKSATLDLLVPAFISMLIFWPIALAAFATAPQLVPLVLAIGMSIHWPVIGWTYGRTALFSAHAISRAIVCFVLWTWFPSTRFTFLPLAVSIIYLLTIAAILFTLRRQAAPRLHIASCAAV